MKLSDLTPKLEGTVADGFLSFDCPHPGCGHRVGVAISSAPFHERPARASERPPTEPEGSGMTAKVWRAWGTFPDTLSLDPSINVVETDADGNVIRTRCWHGFIKQGEVT